jgi:hypothetical protein
MRFKMTLSKLWLIAMAVFLTWPAAAEQSYAFGDYVVHYNAFNSSILEPEIAKTYGVQRSKYRALVNVSVLRKVMDTTGEPVSAKLEGYATNLNKQLKPLDFREIYDRRAIYYLAPISITNGETLDVVLKVTPEGQKEPETIKFRQQFFTE